MRRGEIWWAELPPPAGSEPGYRRPVLILQSDEFNRSRIDTVIVAVLTTNLKSSLSPGNVLVTPQETGLNRDSVVNVSQIFTADRSSLTEYVGTLSPRIMREVDEGMRLVLDL